MRKIFPGALVLALLASSGVAAAQEARDFNPNVRRSVRNDPEAERRTSPPQQARERTQREAAPSTQGSRDGENRRWQGDEPRRGGERPSERWGERERLDRHGPGAVETQRQRSGQQPSTELRTEGDRRIERRAPGGNEVQHQRPGGEFQSRDRRHSERREWRDPSRWDHPRRHQTRPSYDHRRYAPIWRGHDRYWGWTYAPPPGFYVRRWSYGDVLPRGWWAPRYQILDWWAYGLPFPPAGYEWVRVGDDAVLVDMFTGRIVQVAYQLFW